MVSGRGTQEVVIHPLGLPGGGRPAGCSGQFANMDIEETSPKDIG